MHHRHLALAALAVAMSGCGSAASRRAEPALDQARAAAPSAHPARVLPPARADGKGRRIVPPRLTPALPPGSVGLENGAFTDRVAVTDLRLRPGERPLASGRILNVTDVSTLLAMEIRADFYDALGRYVASGVRRYGRGPAFSRGPLAFSVRASRTAPRAVSALLTIPNLVNE